MKNNGDDVQKRVEDKISQVKTAAEDVAEKVSSRVEDARERVSDGAEEVAHEVRRGLSHAKRRGARMLGDAEDYVEDTVDGLRAHCRSSDCCIEYIRRKPLQSIAIATIAGALLVALPRVLMRIRD